MSFTESIKRKRGRPKKTPRKFNEIRPNVPNPNPRKFLRPSIISFRIDKSAVDQIDERAKAVGLNRSEYIRKLLFYSILYMLSAEDYELFVKRAERLQLSEYDFARRIIMAYLKEA